MSVVSPAQAGQFLAEKFAPWVAALGLRVEEVGAEGMMRLRLPFSDQLVRPGGTLSGQALMAAADTACVLALAASFGEFRPVATVAQNMSLLRPVANDDVLVEARDGREAAHATSTFALPA